MVWVVEGDERIGGVGFMDGGVEGAWPDVPQMVRAVSLRRRVGGTRLEWVGLGRVVARGECAGCEGGG